MFTVKCPNSGRKHRCKTLKTVQKLKKALNNNYIESMEASEAHHAKVVARKAAREALLIKKPSK